MRRWLLIFGPLIVGVLLLAGAAEWARPRVEEWVLRNLEAFSRAELPVVISAEEFHVSFFLPRAEMKNLKIVTKPELGLGETEIRADRVSAKLDLLQILTGRLSLSTVLVEGFDTELNIDPLTKGSGKAKDIDWDPIFRTLKKIPISRIAMQSSSVRVVSPREKLDLELIEFDLLLVNERDRLQARFDLQDGDLTWAELTTPLRAQFDLTLSPQGLDVSDLRLLGLGSLLRGSGGVSDLSRIATAPTLSTQFEIKAALPQVEQFLKKIKKFPKLDGSAELKGNLELKRGSLVAGGFRLFGQNLAVDQFKIGQVETEGRLQGNSVRIPRLSLTASAGLVDFQNTELQLTRDDLTITAAQFKTSGTTDSVDVHQLLADLGVGDLPLELFISGQVNCDGVAWPDPQVKCETTAVGEEIEVRSDTKATKSIVQVPRLEAKGRLSLDLEKFKYEADLKAGEDQGKSSGTVIYRQGFDIEFSTPLLHMRQIENLADLKIEGAARISGRTWGDSDAGRFQLQLEGQDVVFEDFQLGQPKFNLGYEKGTLSFDNVKGSLGASTYEGQLKVDLKNERLTATAQSSRLDLVDVAQALERRLKFPVEVTGTGVANVTLSGPLQINQLTYKARGQFSHVTAAGETFDLVQSEVHCDEGEFRFDRTVAIKAGHEMTLTGEGHPDGQVKFLVKGANLPLEQSENISLLNSNVSGLLDFTLDMTGHIRSIQYLLKTQIRNVIVEEQDLPDTVAEIRFNDREMSGHSDLVGGKLQTQFQIPFDDQGPFSLTVAARDWNFTSLFTLLGAGTLLNEYQASLTGTLALKAEQGGFWRATGQAKAERLMMKRGSLSLENPEPLDVQMRSGMISVNKFRLKGPSTDIEVRGDHNTRESLDLHLKAQSELRLFQIFLPFLEELSGRANVTLDLGGKIGAPELLGQARTENAFVKIKGFPHPLEKINSETQFSQTRIYINQARGEMAGGTFSGDGNILINGMRDLPTQINIKVNNVTLNVPDHVRTNGSGELVLSGKWFPFLLSGVYRVQGGLVDMEFGADNLTNSVKKSSYLPQMILQKAFEPILLDLQIVLEQPLPVKNSQMEGSVTGQLQVKGIPSSPLLFGQLSAEKGAKLLFRDKIFDVQTANIKFNDPKEINPELYITARSRIDIYDINMLLQGTAKNPQPRLSSLPPLTETDIVSLIALGVTSEKQEKRLQGREDNSNSGGYQIVTGVMQQVPLFQKVQKASGFTVQFSSNYDDTKNVEVKKVIISRQLNEKVKISATSLVGEQASREFKIEYAFTPNFSTIGTYQQVENNERNSLQTDQTQQNNSILGLDLEFRQEFR